MLLFQKRFHPGLTSGAVTLTFRLWDRPRVKPGGRYRVHPIGVVEVDAVSQVTVGDITAPDAVAAGFTSVAELEAYLAPVALARGAPLIARTPVYRIALHHAGDGDRVSLAMDDHLGPEELAELERRLARLDRDRPWTREVLRLIARFPRVAASKLAARRGEPTAPFKVNVRKLKRLGLTMSFEVGYELSPRGRAFLARRRGRRAPRAVR